MVELKCTYFGILVLLFFHGLLGLWVLDSSLVFHTIVIFLGVYLSYHVLVINLIVLIIDATRTRA